MGGGGATGLVGAGGLAAGALAGFSVAAFKAAQAASDVEEALNLTNVVFGRASERVEEFASSAAVNLAQTEAEALRAVGTIGNLAVSMGLPEEAAADLGISLTQLATDIASLQNVAVEEAFVALRAGLVGETEPLRRLGVNINQAAIETEALRLGLTQAGEELDSQAKLISAYSLIVNQTATSQGDFANTSEGMANQLRILEAQFGTLVEQLGVVVLPMVTDFVTVLNSLVRGANLAAEAVGGLANRLEDVQVIGPTVTILRLLADVLPNASAETTKLADASDIAASALEDEAEAAEVAADAFVNLASAQAGLPTDDPSIGGAFDDATTSAQNAGDAISGVVQGTQELNRALEDTQAAAQEAFDELKPDFGDRFEDEADKAEDALDKVTDAQESLAEAIADSNDRIQDAFEGVADAREDGADRIADAQERLADTQEDSAERIVDARERLVRVEEDSERRIGDARQRLADVIERANQRIEDIERRVEDAREERDRRALRDAEEDLAILRERSGRDIEQAREAVGRAEIDAARAIADAREAVVDAEESAAEAVADAREALADAIEDSNERILDAEERLADAQEDAADRVAEAKKRVLEAEKELAAITEDIVSDLTAAFDANASAVEEFDQAIADVTEKLNNMGIDPEITEAFIADLEELGPEGIRTIRAISNATIPELRDLARAYARQSDAIAESVGLITGELNEIGNTEHLDGIADVEDGLDDIGESARNAGDGVSRLLVLLNELAGTELANSPEFRFVTSPGFRFGFQHGGRITPAGGIVGESGPEFFAPDRAGRIFSNRDLINALRSAGGGGQTTIVIHEASDPEAVAAAVDARLARRARR